MATSNSINFGLTRDDAITEALELLGVLGEGETSNAEMLTSSARTLNLMVKAWQGRGVNIFAVEDVFVFQDGSQEYSLLNGSSTKFTNTYDYTTLSTAAVSGSGTIEVTDITGFEASDVIGVILETGVWHWTSINGSPTGSTITLSASLPAAAEVGALVVGYATQSRRPMRVMEAYRRTKDGQDIPLEVVGDRTYNLLTPKDAAGVVNTVWYDWQTTTPKLYVWPVTSVHTDVIFLRCLRTLQDLDGATDDMDFPQEWYHAITLNLALQLAPKYGVSSEYNSGVDPFETSMNAQYELTKRFTCEFSGLMNICCQPYVWADKPITSSLVSVDDRTVVRHSVKIPQI